MATNPRHSTPAIALACCLFAAASAWCDAAEAKTGLAPVVVEGGLGLKLAEKVQRAALRALAIHGVNPPRPTTLSPHLGLSSPTDPPTTAQCIAAGEALDLDVIAVIRVRPSVNELETEMRVVVVETRKEYLYVVHKDAAHTPRAMVELVHTVFEKVSAWDTDLVAAERALGRDCDEEYTKYKSSRTLPDLAFADYLYLQADKRMRDGKIIAIAIPTVLVALTATVLFVGLRPRPSEDDEDEGSGMACLACGMGEIFRTLGFVVVAVIGFGGSIGAIVGGFHMNSDGKRDVDRLRPLVPNPPQREKPEMELSLAPSFSPEGGGLALDLRF